MSSNARQNHSAPGIYTREFDQTYSVKSLGVTTLGLVGETLIGPAFQPIPISNYTEFKTFFGGQSTEKYSTGYPRYELPYVAKSYLSESNQLYVTRVLGLSGFKYQGMWSLYVDGTGATVSNKTIIANIRPKSYYVGEVLTPLVTGLTFSTGITGSSVDFTITANINSGATEKYNVSLDPTKKNYILKVIGNGVNDVSASKIFVEEMYEGVLNNMIDTGTTTNSFYSGVVASLSGKIDTSNDYSAPFSYASTPWFISEVKGNKIIPLFRLLTLSDGNNASNLFKVSILNSNKDTLKFDLQIRSASDTDATPVILESYKNCTLDPTDINYIGNKIGTVDELFSQKSKYVVVEIDENPQVAQSIPLGFSGFPTKVVSGYTAPAIVYNTEYYSNVKQRKQYFGLSNITGVDNDYFSYKGVNATGMTYGFHMENVASGFNINGASIISLSTESESSVASDTSLNKFTTYFSGGFDGWDIFRTNRTLGNDYQYFKYIKANTTSQTNFKTYTGSYLETTLSIPNVLENNILTSDYYAYLSAVRSFSNPDNIDINLFATPGIDTLNNSLLISEVVDMLETERKDAFYIVNTPDKDAGSDDTKSQMKTADSVTSDLSDTGIDTSFAATYFPWCKYYDSENAQYIFLSPTRDVVKNIALTDNTTYSWFAPAGYSRGSVDCVNAKKNLILSEIDTLYDGRINAIKTFAQDGVKIWGQKTLLDSDQATNRIGVRRMMLYLRKTVSRSNLPLIFDPNDNTTKNKFLEIVTPILTSVKNNRGVEDYKIVIDDSPEAKSRHEMNVIIYVKPIGALEYINIDFVLKPEGFDFNNI